MIVYHIFDGNTTHHVPKFIYQLNKFSKKNNIKFQYILYNYTEKVSEKYQPIFDEIKKDDFLLVSKDGVDLFKKINAKKIKKNRFIIHGFLPYKALFLFLLTNKLQYFSWVCWGSGIKHRDDIKKQAKKVFLKKIYNNFSSINVLMEGDRQTLLKDYQVQTNIFVIPYWTTLEFYKDTEKLKGYFSKDKINILVGHTAHESCKHIEILSLLEKYKTKNIRIICFLNYGGASSQQREKYVKEVIAHGEALFGSKFVPFIDLLDLKEYESVMKSIDITIIPQKSQAGLGAIYKTILNKGSVFVSEKSKNDNWLQSLGITTGYIKDISKYNYNDLLLKIDATQKTTNKEKIINKFNKNKLSKEWLSFFEKV